MHQLAIKISILSKYDNFTICMHALTSPLFWLQLFVVFLPDLDLVRHQAVAVNQLIEPKCSHPQVSACKDSLVKNR